MRLASYLATAALVCLPTLAFGQSSVVGLHAPIEQEWILPTSISDQAFRDLQTAVEKPSIFQESSPAIGIKTIAAEPADNTSACLTDGDRSQCDNCCNECWPQWYLDAGSIFLWRNNDAKSQQGNNPRTINFDAGIGPQIVLGIRTSPNSGWEGEYFSALDMNGSAAFSYSVGSMRFNYSSELHNLEINYVHTWDRFSILGGFRFVRFSENFELQVTRYGFSDDFRESLGSHCDNDLYGGQIGARWQQANRDFFWEVTGKAGVFGNGANQNLSFSGNGTQLENNYLIGPTVYDTVVSFVGDLNFSAGYRLSEVWAVRLGYNLMWIDRVALAPDQIKFWVLGQPYPIFTDGGIFLHGVNVGLEGRW